MSPPSEDTFDLARFIDAQSSSYKTALSELRAGEKRSHWMWYIFPQVAGLGSSSMTRRYAIRSRAEAKAYLEHPILGPRILECAKVMLAVEHRTANEIMGSPDDLKLQSSMTLFAEISPPDSVFQRVVEKYYNGAKDPKTLDFLRRENGLPIR